MKSGENEEETFKSSRDDEYEKFYGEYELSHFGGRMKKYTLTKPLAPPGIDWIRQQHLFSISIRL